MRIRIFHPSPIEDSPALTVTINRSWLCVAGSRSIVWATWTRCIDADAGSCLPTSGKRYRRPANASGCRSCTSIKEGSMADDSGRRDVLKRLGLIAGAIGTGSGMSLLSRAAGAQALPHLSLQDPIAQALAYHEDAATVKPEQFPSYRKGERCSTCAQ